MLNFDQIRQLIDIVCERELGGLEVEDTGFRLKIEGRPAATVQVASAAAAAPQVAVAPLPAVAAEHPQISPASTAAVAADTDGRHVINSPIVGTFYAASSPDADPYVQVGDQVQPGQVLCIVEAMKLMNEIEADVAGEVVEVFPSNAQPVEYGEPLFALKVD